MAVVEFRPKWTSAPGDTIRDVLRERHISLEQFARHLGQGNKEAEGLLEGRLPITLAVARQLESLLGASVAFWMARDSEYRRSSNYSDVIGSDWVRDLPVRDMVKFGWIPAPRPADELTACLKFFGVQDIPNWHRRYSQIIGSSAFRTSAAFDSHPGAVAAWLRQGELEAEKIPCKPWNRTGFQAALREVRPLTRKKEPGAFLPTLESICAECGVAVVVVRAPQGCRASGATRFLSVQKAVLLLSFRYLRDDQFWFTFFHEAGHLYLHEQTRVFLEGISGVPSSPEEQEANEFAANILIPADSKQELLALRRESTAIIRFARKLGISPGIVVGQLQHFGRIPHSSMNTLKRFYRWS